MGRRYDMIGKTIGQYQVIDKIGEGGMGAVYKAEDTTLHRLVALKTLSGHLTEDEEAQERFVREAQSASSLNHPNITTVHEFIEDDDTRLICMEYIEGKTIRNMVESGIVSVGKAIDIITQAAEALEAAHKKGILHRDVKSANIMVNMEGRVKVMDFGLAHLEERSQLTRTGTTMGTLSYSSPEQISGRTVDKRSEIFSLGVVFYELLTGKLPFAATNEAEIVFAIINNEPPKPSSVRDDVPELVEAVLTRMLEKDPGLRYQNCGEVISNLTGIRKEMETSTISAAKSLKGNRRIFPIQVKSSTVLIGALVTLILAATIIILSNLFSSKPREIIRLAVLPFENLGPAEDEYFADGISDAISNRFGLLQSDQLEVIGWISTSNFKQSGLSPHEFGKQLNADYLLVGTVRWDKSGQDANRVRISPQLIRVPDGTQVWSAEPYEGVIDDIFELQRNVASQVANALDIVLGEQEQQHLARDPTENMLAYQHYLMGRFHWNHRTQSSMERSLNFYRLAIEEDTEFALAYAGIADVYVSLRWYNLLPIDEAGRNAREAALQAIRLDEALSEAHGSMGNVLGIFDWDWAGAIQSFTRAIDLNPSNAEAHHQYAHLLTNSGRIEEGVREMEKALDLEPLSININGCLGQNYYWARRYDEAIDQLEHTIALDPEYGDPYCWLAFTYLMQRMFDEAFEMFEKAASFPRYTARMTGARGYAYAIQGDRENARTQLDRLEQQAKSGYVDPCFEAWIHTALEDNETAIRLLQQAYSEKANWCIFFKIDPLYAPLHDDPRFQKLIENMEFDISG